MKKINFISENFLILVIMIGLGFPPFVFSQEEVKTVSTVAAPDKLKDVRQEIVNLVQRGNLVSMSVAVAIDGKIVWEESFGYADRERKIAASPNTIYGLGSLSKSIVSTGMMKLIDERKVKLSDSAEKYLTPLKLKYYEGNKKAKVVDILNMTAGIPHGLFELPEADNPQTEDEKNRFFAKIGISVFPPGEVFQYSNNSMGLVQRMIEKASGKVLKDYMREEVFLPLGMKNTLTSYDPTRSSEIAVSYSQSNNPFAVRYFLPAGGGGFYSSAHDLILYAMFHLKNHLPEHQKIISDSTLDLMHKYQGKAETQGWHLGFFGDDTTIISNGLINGANSHLQLKPKQNLAVVCLTNKSTSLADEFAQKIIEKLSPSAVEESAKQRQEYGSKYNNPYKFTPELSGIWSGHIDIQGNKIPVKLSFANDGKVFIELNNQNRTEIANTVFNSLKRFKGTFQGPLTGSESVPNNQISNRLNLVLKNKRLYGSIDSSFQRDGNSYLIPIYISLAKTAV